ncbi:MAG TPA: methyltransferase domain-containing protein [Candidatus Acidoferrales bacterium]|nr:methyltransferase domain-containing protein [Candidatus Acidoferrales bacterium]
MNQAVMVSAGAPAHAVASVRPTVDQALGLEELARAVANNALLNTEVDRKIVARLMETREEVQATQRAMEGLRKEFGQLARGVGQLIENFRLQQQRPASATAATEPTSLRTSVAPRLLSPQRLSAMGTNLRLNLRCGHLPTPDYFNIDTRELPGVDMIADVRTLPFHAGTVAEIYAAHLMEHFTESELRSTVIPGWHRVLKPGGLLRIIVPDAEGMIQAFSRGEYPFENFRKVTFGSQDYPGNFRYTMFSRQSLRELLQSFGFGVDEYTAVARRNGLCLEMEINAVKAS